MKQLDEHDEFGRYVCRFFRKCNDFRKHISFKLVQSNGGCFLYFYNVDEDGKITSLAEYRIDLTPYYGEIIRINSMGNKASSKGFLKESYPDSDCYEDTMLAWIVDDLKTYIDKEDMKAKMRIELSEIELPDINMSKDGFLIK